MALTDVLMIAATFLGPIAAVQAQKWVERWRDENNRRIQLFKTLMATRGAILSPAHVQALNSINLEFQGERFRNVRASWRDYLDHLNNGPEQLSNESLDAFGARQRAWGERQEDLLVALLKEMGSELGYSFDSVDVKRAIYSPRAHSQVEQEQELVRRHALRVLGGEQGLKMEVTRIHADPEAVSAHQAMVRSAAEAFHGGALKVVVAPAAAE